MLRLLTVFIGVLVSVVLFFFGSAIVGDFFVWNDSEWDYGVIEAVKKPAKKKNETRESFSNRTYKINFRGYLKNITVLESVDYNVGDRIRLVYSPRFPHNYKLKIPNIIWICVWAAVFIFCTPFILYHVFLFAIDSFRRV